MSWAQIEAKARTAFADQPNGVSFQLYPNGQTRSQQMFAGGALDGLTRCWRPDGSLMREVG